ncbi:hypothetical protein RsS62_64320 [Rhizobium dioscoreae]|uniref:hypothetical protein n=1 Tax=Rhizobium dioscoreae TaxID=2653122 RepID=UPI00126E85AA|nr:hypothetical protein [Rhizobium dioscoreae]GES47180.1 hypothetical protein RsS62_64320 [Rhizobium dioscoreae]
MEQGTLKEVLFKWADVIISQSNDLWTVCLPFFVACTLVIMHLHGNSAPNRPRWLMPVLYISAICSALSLAAGYKLKGSVVTALRGTITTEKIAIPDTAGWDGFAQFVFFFLGLLFFVIALGLKPSIVAKALIDTFRGK